MPASTSAPLTIDQIQDAQKKANALASAGSNAIRTGQFVFFAAFDGTNNTLNNPEVAFPRISRQIMMSKLKRSHANATNEICRRVQVRGGQASHR